MRSSWLEVKPRIRKLFKHPGLALVGGLGVPAAIGACSLAVLCANTAPLDGGVRVVGIEIRNTETNTPERRVPHDFAVWRARLESVRDPGATCAKPSHNGVTFASVSRPGSA